MNATSSTFNPSRAATPAVSVVIPARNAARTLAKTLASLQNQDMTDWEAIVVDDGSKDNTWWVAEGIAGADRRIRCLRGPQRGVSAARNAGIAEARAPVVAFLDADDLWRPGKLRAHLKHLADDPRVGLTFDRVLFVDERGRSTGVESTARVRDLAAHAYLYENPACTASTLVARREALEAIGAFDESMRCSEDLELMLRLRCTTEWRVQGLSEVLTYYRASPAGASASLDAMQEGWETLLAKGRAYAPDLVARHERAARALHLRYLARRAARLDLPARLGLGLLGRAASSHPLALIRQPRRTFGTLLALLARAVAQSLVRTQRG